MGPGGLLNRSQRCQLIARHQQTAWAAAAVAPPAAGGPSEAHATIGNLPYNVSMSSISRAGRALQQIGAQATSCRRPRLPLLRLLVLPLPLPPQPLMHPLPAALPLPLHPPPSARRWARSRRAGANSGSPRPPRFSRLPGEEHHSEAGMRLASARGGGSTAQPLPIPHPCMHAFTSA